MKRTIHIVRLSMAFGRYNRNSKSSAAALVSDGMVLQRDREIPYGAVLTRERQSRFVSWERLAPLPPTRRKLVC